MRLELLATIIFLVSSTMAQAADQTPDAVTKPALLAGPGNNCAQLYYPASAIRAGEQGAVLLNLSIDKTGKVTKADIAQSSGFADLDKAATDCANDWHFQPGTKNGNPVESTKPFRIVWKLAPTNIVPHLKTPMESACADIFSDAANRWTVYQSVALQFRIAADGTVLHPFVAVSSGDTLFDAKSVRCVTRLKYTSP